MRHKIKSTSEQKLEKYRRIFETIPVAILTIDAETERIIDANQCLLDMFNYSRDDLIGKKFWEIGIPKEIIEIQDQSSRMVYKDIPLKTQDNRDLTIDLIYDIYRLGDSKIIQCLFQNTIGRKWVEDHLHRLSEQLHEKTIELEVANRSLQEINQLKTDFVSTVSHELRTPLTIIKEGVTVVLDGIAGDINQQQKKMLGSAKGNIDRLTYLINDLLDIAKIEARRFELKRELVDIAGLVNTACLDFIPVVKEKGLELKMDFGEKKKINIFIDKSKIIQVIVNLINNAIKFTKEGSISISLKEMEESVECSVTDTGVEISEEDLPNVFMKFQQFGKEIGPGAHGTGLGLAICKGIVELHNGKIRVESPPTGLNNGTRFTFTLPKYTAKELFKEYITNELKEAIREQSPLSIIVFDINNINAVEEKLGKDRVASLVHNLEQLIKNNIERKADVAIKDTRSILLVLPQTKKEDALIVIERISQLFNDYLLKQKLDISIEILPKIAAFPEDGNTREELLAKTGEDKKK